MDLVVFNARSFDALDRPAEVPSDRTMFYLHIPLGWDEEHGHRSALFRNGAFVTLGLDGF